MGELKVIKLIDKADKANYIHQLIKDIEALEIMIRDGLIEKSPIRIGAEQEFCLINNEFLPSSNGLDILNVVNDDHFTTEIGNYNLELNLDPLELKSDCFSKLHMQLSNLLNKVDNCASKHKTKMLLAGILPTLTLKHVEERYMTPITRYSVLNEAIKESRTQEFNIHIKGVDEVNFLHDSVMLEGCNTSFQLHLQINPDNFVESYNWAQAISGPVLSICTNSPMLFGRELWSETRIALFTQSVDTRANSFMLNEKQSRVSFGKAWATGNVADIFKNNISRFRSLVTSEFTVDSVEMLKRKEIPKLKALNLHNGTVYPWNRPCYGVGNGKPHLRIENRYIPSGPTTTDEIANMMFWVGIMVGKPKKYNNIHKKMDFKDVKSNFFNAARYGMSAQFNWNGKYISSHQLILDELLPIAFKGLYSMGVSPKDVEHYLTVIENRVKSHNGSQWMIKSYRNLLKSNKPYKALQILTANMYAKQEKNYPVSAWRTLLSSDSYNPQEKAIVKHKMTTDIFSVNKNDSIELVLNIMKWKNIHHMPVINNKRKLVGLLTWNDVKSYFNNPKKQYDSVSTIMRKNLYTITQYKDLQTAKDLMKDHDISCLPVIRQEKLIGLITSKDI